LPFLPLLEVVGVTVPAAKKRLHNLFLPIITFSENEISWPTGVPLPLMCLEKVGNQSNPIVGFGVTVVDMMCVVEAGILAIVSLIFQPGLIYFLYSVYQLPCFPKTGSRPTFLT